MVTQKSDTYIFKLFCRPTLWRLRLVLSTFFW